MKRIYQLFIVGLAVVCLNQNGQAQIEPGSFGYYQDALRFSQTLPFGTSRFQGIGGAGSVLGGDLGASAINPAGLGFFNRSQFVLTPSLNFKKFNNDFLGNNVLNEDTKLEIANFGLAINFNKGDLEPGAWRGGTLAVTYNRTNNFNQLLSYSGQNNNSSIIDAMLDRADGFFPEELGGIEQVGYDHYLINPLPDAEDVYVSFVQGFPRQNERILRRGSTDQINVSFGGNFNDQLYLAAGFGFVSSDYSSHRVFTENFNDPALSSFQVDERLDVTGSGLNVNLGVIFRPSDLVRLGASYTSPTWYSFSEESDAIYRSEYNNYDVANFTDDNGNRIIQEDTVLNSLQSATNIFFSDYRLRTPSKLNLGVAFFIGKSGFITADVERLNYSNAHISSIDFDSESDNGTINNIYQATTNIRLGGEYRYNIFRFRMGYASMGDPFKESFDGLDRSRTTVSGGFGVNVGRYFVDLAISQTNFKDSFTSYTFVDGSGPTAITESKLTKGSLTFGLNF
ncbi:long-chain fatty acid transporter [Roseivirga sp. UBA838]|uniref:OmpP1/FadL family transporter n=1 Tax=Roseivirga sp. UBA838 TaxID=1947393 RepID=UPI002581189E|nr:long-chain fatty acid transporter [Roseivirga sp. UBA838]|tara:strand:+ start:1419 stop:2948 length:1530 start_codon:yes stop_codon:yes gene_type:complete